MIQFKDLKFNDWYGDDSFKCRDAEFGTKFMRVRIKEYIRGKKHIFCIEWDCAAFQMENEYGENFVEVNTEEAVEKAIKKEVYGRMEWVKSSVDEFLAL